MCAFDLLIMNRDRHDRNFFLLSDDEDPYEPPHRIVIVDHDEALFNHGVETAELIDKTKRDERTCVWWTSQVSRVYDLRIASAVIVQAAEAMQAVSDDVLSRCILNAGAGLSDCDSAQIVDILVKRKTRLPEIVERFVHDKAVCTFFPSMP